MVETSMNAKEFRREVGREIRRLQKLQKERKTQGRRLELRILRTTYDILGIGYKEMKIIHSNPRLWKDAQIHLQGLVDWCEFLLTIQPEERRERKNVEVEFQEEK